MSDSNLILLIEDHIDLLELWQFWLKKEGFKTEIATNGVEGLKQIEKERPNLIILDHMMPIMSGIEFIDEIRKKSEYCNIPVIMLTAAGSSDLHISALHKGVDKFLEKPVKKDIFLAEIKNTIKIHKFRENIIQNAIKEIEVKAEQAMNPLEESIESSDEIVKKLSMMKSDIKSENESNSGILESLIYNREIIIILLSTLNEYSKLIDNAFKSNNFDEFKKIMNNYKTDESVEGTMSETMEKVINLYDSNMAILNELLEKMQCRDILIQQNNNVMDMLGDFRIVLRNILVRFNLTDHSG